MNPKVLFVISSDPRASHRPAEALRIAAGVGAWEAAQISVYLHGEAARLLGEDDEVQKHLGMIGSRIFVEAGKSSNEKARAISGRELAELAAASDYVVHF